MHGTSSSRVESSTAVCRSRRSKCRRSKQLFDAEHSGARDERGCYAKKPSSPKITDFHYNSWVKILLPAPQPAPSPTSLPLAPHPFSTHNQFPLCFVPSPTFALCHNHTHVFWMLVVASLCIHRTATCVTHLWPSTTLQRTVNSVLSRKEALAQGRRMLLE